MSPPESTPNLQRYGIIIAIILLVICILGWIYSKSTMNTRDCNNMNELYNEFPLIRNIDWNGPNYKKFLLRDYYIKTAYNCCAPGTYKNTFVNTCALADCIKQGARCLDFQIYSLNNSPVIAVSSVEDFYTKESYNSIPFADALNMINTKAFAGATCPNPNDPLILNFRIFSNNSAIMNIMATDIYNNLENYILPKEYSYEYDGKNLGSVPLVNFKRKIIIIVDTTNSSINSSSTKLDEYINIKSGSPFFRSLSYNDVQYTPDMDELITYNKTCMTLCLPNLSPSPSNPSSSLAMKYGCQLVAMEFQEFDSNMEYYDALFADEGTAFILKPASLRYVPTTIPAPSPPPEEYSYQQRTVQSSYYKFNI